MLELNGGPEGVAVDVPLGTGPLAMNPLMLLLA